MKKQMMDANEHSCPECGAYVTVAETPCDAHAAVNTDEMMLQVRFATATGKFAFLDTVEVSNIDEAKRVVAARHPTAKMVTDDEGMHRFTVKGRNVAFLDT